MTTYTPYISATDAADKLRTLLHDDTTVYVVQRRVSKSGMSRKLSLFVIDHGTPTDTQDQRPATLKDVTGLAAAVFGENLHDADGSWTLKVDGAGMDMHFHTVYSLSRRLYADADTPRPAGAEPAPRDGGYCLTHRTL